VRDVNDLACQIWAVSQGYPSDTDLSCCWDEHEETIDHIVKLLEEDRRELETEVERLKQWVKDLHSGMYINCVYCGHRYGPNPGTPVAMADVLRAHIEQCPEHPLSKARAENAALVTKLQLVGCIATGEERGDDLRDTLRRISLVVRAALAAAGKEEG